MLVAIVRVAETNELVGFFWGEELRNIWIAVDEVTDPSECEYKLLKWGGGVYWRDAPPVPIIDKSLSPAEQDEQVEAFYQSLGEVVFCEKTDGVLDDECSMEAMEWTSLAESMDAISRASVP